MPPHHHHHPHHGPPPPSPSGSSGSPPTDYSKQMKPPWVTGPGGELRYFDPACINLTRQGAAVRLTVKHEYSALSVTIVRAFPMSRPDTYLSILDERQKEIGLVADPTQLDETSREIVAEELARRYRLPEIRQVLDVKERFGTQEWYVDTNRGPCTFTTRDLFDNARLTAEGHILITDVDGNRYLIVDAASLDHASRDLLEAHT